MKLLPILAALAVMTLPGAASAQEKLDAENLLVGVPDGFIVGDKAEDGKGLVAAEFIPKGETVQDWTSMITVEVFRGAPFGRDKFAQHLKDGWEGACKDSKVEKLGEGRVNGYRYSAWYFGCPLNPQTNKPESMWLKAIRGNDAFYAIQYSFRALPTDQFKAIADKYLGAASVCDTRKPEHPCPTAK